MPSCGHQQIRRKCNPPSLPSPPSNHRPSECKCNNNNNDNNNERERERGLVAFSMIPQRIKLKCQGGVANVINIITVGLYHGYSQKLLALVASRAEKKKREKAAAAALRKLCEKSSVQSVLATVYLFCYVFSFLAILCFSSLKFLARVCSSHQIVFFCFMTIKLLI